MEEYCQYCKSEMRAHNGDLVFNAKAEEKGGEECFLFPMPELFGQVSCLFDNFREYCCDLATLVIKLSSDEQYYRVTLIMHTRGSFPKFVQNS